MSQTGKLKKKLFKQLEIGSDEITFLDPGEFNRN